MNHVIEHVEKPQEVLKSAYELLRPGGRLWLGLPNPQAPGIRLFGASWKGFHPPFHLVIPSQRVLRDWLTDCGFKNVRALRRGMQSRGLWAESMRIYQRDGGEVPDLILHLIKMACDLGATMCPVWSEETVIVAEKPAAVA